MNKNINNHNGKEVHKDQIQRNERKESKVPSPDRMKKKYKGKEADIHPVEPRKDPVDFSKKNNPDTQKSSNNPNRNAPKGQAVKMGDKGRGIQAVDYPVKKRPVEVIKPVQGSTNGKPFVRQEPASDSIADNRQQYGAETKSLNSNTPKYLYIIAAVLFLAWIVGYFFYELDANVHMLLALAVMVGIISFLQRKRK